MSTLRNGVKRKRVALAGFGTVGGGVYERLCAAPENYQVVGVICRSPERLAKAGAPASLFAANIGDFPEFDILVEAIGGLDPAGDIVAAALARGADVVTANKTLVSRRFAAIDEAAKRTGARLSYSAAVGGGVPMLETVDEVAAVDNITAVEAVLNGTTNFVLDRIGAGASPEEAIRQAQEAGFAEADPSADINGIDAAEKLSLLARRAFGVDVDPSDIHADPLAAVSAQSIAAAARQGTPFKQVASARRTDDGVALSVRLRQVKSSDPLAKPRLEENCLVVSREGGAPVIVHGRGAGREPTVDSVFADIERLTFLPERCDQDGAPRNSSGPVKESATSSPR